MTQELNIDKSIKAIDYILKKNEERTKEPYAFQLPDPKVDVLTLISILFHADSLSFNERDYTISGDIYLAKQEGAIPDCIYHELILKENNPLKKRSFGSPYSGYYETKENNISFSSTSTRRFIEVPLLEEEDKKYLDKAIEEYIDLSREQVQEKIHNNPLWKKAYEKGPDSVISFNDMNEKEKTTE